MLRATLSHCFREASLIIECKIGCHLLLSNWPLVPLLPLHWHTVSYFIYFSALALLLLEHKFQKGRRLVFYLKGIPVPENQHSLSPSFCRSMNISIHMKEWDKNIKALWKLSAKLKYNRHGLKVFSALLSQETLYSHSLFVRNCFMEKFEDESFVKLWEL